MAQNSEVTKYSDVHVCRRIFLGPMPEKVISTTEAQARKERKRGLFRLSDDPPRGEGENVPPIIQDQALRFFINEGGKMEDWGETQKRSAAEGMLQRWKESEWGAIWSARKNVPQQTSRWVGGSFEIGNLLGMNIMEEATECAEETLSRLSDLAIPLTSAVEQPSSTTSNTFVTAPQAPPPIGDAGTQEHLDTEGQVPASATSSTALLRPPLGPRESAPPSKARTEVLRRPIIKVSSILAKSDSNVNSQHRDKGKGKAVHYAEILVNGDDSAIAPPRDVLERSGSEIQDTSAGATVNTPVQSPPVNPPDAHWGDVILRDRMLIRVNYTKYENIGPIFDEIQHRTADYLQFEDWGEFLVAWRKDRIEIYEDYSIPGKEWITGHKHLSYIVPLSSSRTKLSMYSFVDLTFCITCPPTSTIQVSNKLLRSLHRKEGTNVFIFKLKSRTRALDWMWLLWRHLGGRIPQTLEVRNPGLNTRVKIDVPSVELGTEEAYTVFTPENVIALCIQSLQSEVDWKYIIERQLQQGKRLGLAWRVDTILDWVWQANDSEQRPWAVLYGLALRQSSKPPFLEVRLAEHAVSHVQKDETRLSEPPAIEGYLERVKPSTQARQAVYITTHDGNLFLLSPSQAHPPNPPGLQALDDDSGSFSRTLREREVARGARQLMTANGVCDLRVIIAVRRAFHQAPQNTHNEGHNTGDDEWANVWARRDAEDSDGEDEGGDEGLAKSSDKQRLRMKRAFELLLKNGHVVRFEAYSRRVAVEWIQRLRALINYWRQRHHSDAHDEMDLAQASRPRLTPRIHIHHDSRAFPPEAPKATNAPMPFLSSLYHWCTLEGCRPIVRGGFVFMRRGLRGQYKLVQLFLASGSLVAFRVKPSSSLHLVMRRKVNLTDAYVYSGYLAAMSLPQGQYSAANSLPRRYQDGLETDDPEEDLLFMIWHRPQALAMPTKKLTTSQDAAAPSASVPPLSAKRKLLVFRTRSKIERDSWCWSLNCEIEKLARAQRDREEKIRNTGALICN